MRLIRPTTVSSISLLIAGWMMTACCANGSENVTFNSVPGQVSIRVGSTTVADYVYGDPQIPRPYLTNVRTTDGIQVTRNHPPIEGRDRTDHASMHPGIWMSFGDLGGSDFWRNKARVVQKRFVEEPVGRGDEGSFAVENHYLDGAGRFVCKEICRYSFHVRKNGFAIHWNSTFSSDREFGFGDQEEMGLGVRVATEIAVASKQGGRILDSQGRRNEKEIWGKAARWCDYGGPIDSRFVGITVVPHPDNFRESRWHVRDYGFLTANPFALKAFQLGPEDRQVIKTGEALQLRFVVFIHSSDESSPPDLPALLRSQLSDLVPSL